MKTKKITLSIMTTFLVLIIQWCSFRYFNRGEVYAYPVKDNIFSFRQSYHTGLIDISSGEILVKPIYDELKCINERCIAKLNNQYGIIDYNGNEIVDFLYDEMRTWYFSKNIQNILIVKKDGKFSLIDQDGTTLLEPLDEGTNIDKINGPFIVIIKNEQYGVIDFQENTIIPYLRKGIFIHDYIDVDSQIFYTTDNESFKRGFINIEEDLIVEPIYEDLANFNDGMSFAKLNGKYGFINDKNEVIIDFKYDNALQFSEGLASVQYEYKFGYINKSDEVIIDFQYDSASSFVDGIAYIKFSDSNEDYGFINKDRQLVHPIHNSSHELDYENYIGNNTLYYVNSDGTIFYKNYLEDYGLSITKKNDEVFNKYVIKNKNGKVIYENSMNDIKYINENMFCVQSSRWTCLDMEGNELFDKTFSSFVGSDLPLLHFTSNGKHYLYDENGNLIMKITAREYNVHLSKSHQYAVKAQGNKIYTYNLETKEEKVIYKIPFTWKDVFPFI